MRDGVILIGLQIMAFWSYPNHATFWNSRVRGVKGEGYVRLVVRARVKGRWLGLGLGLRFRVRDGAKGQS